MNVSHPAFGSLQLLLGTIYRVAFYEKGVAIDSPLEFLRRIKLWMKFAPENWDFSTRSFPYKDLRSIIFRGTYRSSGDGTSSSGEIYLDFQLNESGVWNAVKCKGGRFLGAEVIKTLEAINKTYPELKVEIIYD